MAEFFLMPQASPTMESGRLLEWRVSEGDKLNPQDVIAEVETDKAAMEIEVFDPAVVLKLLRNAGDMVEVDTPIAILGQSGSDDYSALLAEFESGQSAPKAAPAPAPTAPAKPEKRRAGPAARAARAGDRCAGSADPSRPPSRPPGPSPSISNWSTSSSSTSRKTATWPR